MPNPTHFLVDGGTRLILNPTQIYVDGGIRLMLNPTQMCVDGGTEPLFLPNPALFVFLPEVKIQSSSKVKKVKRMKKYEKN